MTRRDRSVEEVKASAADDSTPDAAPENLQLDVEVEKLQEGLRHYHSRAGAQDDRPGWQAATALVVAPHGPTSAIALIRRAEREGDRWSGDMALPGGVRAPSDRDLAATAARETREEIGVALGDPVARLPDQRGRVSRGTIATFVHILDRRPELTPDPAEVAEALWIPVGHLVDPSAATRFRRKGVSFPAIDHDGRIIWGLTHRILSSFLDVAGIRR